MEQEPKRGHFPWSLASSLDWGPPLGPVPVIILRLPCRGQAGSRPFLDGITEHSGGGCPGFPWLCTTRRESPTLSLVPLPHSLPLLPSGLALQRAHTSISTCLPSAETAVLLGRGSALPCLHPTSFPSCANPQGLTAASSLLGNLCPAQGTQGPSPGPWSSSGVPGTVQATLFTSFSLSLYQTVRQVLSLSPFSR